MLTYFQDPAMHRVAMQAHSAHEKKRDRTLTS
jgi:hypothetical protein